MGQKCLQGGKEWVGGTYSGLEVFQRGFRRAKNGLAKLPVGQKHASGNFLCDRRPSINSVNFPCHQENLCQIPSLFLSAEKPSVNFPCDSLTFRLLPGNFCATERFSVNFCPLSVWPRNFLSPSINFPCSWQTFCQFSIQHGGLLANFRADRRLSVNLGQLPIRPGYLPSTFVNFSCRPETFSQLPSTFCETVGLFVNFPCGR